MFDLWSVALGGAGVGSAYFGFLSLRKGLPALVATVKAKLTGGKLDLSLLQEDIATAHDLISGHEGAIDDLRSRLDAALREFAKLKGQLAASPAAPAPAFLAPSDKAVG